MYEILDISEVINAQINYIFINQQIHHFKVIVVNLGEICFPSAFMFEYTHIIRRPSSFFSKWWFVV